MNYLVSYTTTDSHIFTINTFTYPEAIAISNYASSQGFTSVFVTPLNEAATRQMDIANLVKELFDEVSSQFDSKLSTLLSK